MTGGAAGSWLDFWQRSNRIYVNDRHLAVHCRRVADDILALGLAPDATLLDHGCGDALEAPRIAGRIARLYLYDAASEVRTRLQRRFAGDGRIAVIDDAALAALPEASLDWIVVNSVLQYVPQAALDPLLALWRRKLKRGGSLVLADVIPPGDTMVADTLALLGFAWRGGFFWAALGGLVATFFSDYRKLRQKLGLSVYDEATMLGLLRSAGFDAARRRPNLGFNQTRMTFIARPAAGPPAP
ncbi:MAG: methyltransferase domain-containing protein [Alphaproteobacteria bacterium]|nr:methyltransferase domain-containing protein [Alphaproteobacteria bacterium]